MTARKRFGSVRVRLDELEVEQMPLGSNVWGVGVDDCEFQRLILGGI